MKKYLIIVAALLALVLLGDTLYYRLGVYIPPSSDKPINVVSKIENGQIMMSNKDGSYEVVEIKGVNMGSGVPGYWSTEFHIDKETYLRWFATLFPVGSTRGSWTISSEKDRLQRMIGVDTPSFSVRMTTGTYSNAPSEQQTEARISGMREAATVLIRSNFAQKKNLKRSDYLKVPLI